MEIIARAGKHPCIIDTVELLFHLRIFTNSQTPASNHWHPHAALLVFFQILYPLKFSRPTKFLICANLHFKAV